MTVELDTSTYLTSNPDLNLLVINLLNPHVVLLPAQVKPSEQRLLGH